MVLTEEQAKEVWALLIRRCGVDKNAAIGPFLWHVSKGCTIYPIQGKNGFVGTLHVGMYPYVSCHNETSNRLRTVEATNKALETLRETWY